MVQSMAAFCALTVFTPLLVRTRPPTAHRQASSPTRPCPSGPTPASDPALVSQTRVSHSTPHQQQCARAASHAHMLCARRLTAPPWATVDDDGDPCLRAHDFAAFLPRRPLTRHPVRKDSTSETASTNQVPHANALQMLGNASHLRPYRTRSRFANTRPRRPRRLTRIRTRVAGQRVAAALQSPQSHLDRTQPAPRSQTLDLRHSGPARISIHIAGKRADSPGRPRVTAALQSPCRLSRTCCVLTDGAFADSPIPAHSAVSKLPRGQCSDAQRLRRRAHSRRTHSAPAMTRVPHANALQSQGNVSIAQVNLAVQPRSLALRVLQSSTRR